MDDITVVNKIWQGKNLRANVLFSRAGVAQHIWINSEKGAVLIDTGDGLLRDILATKLDLAQIKGIFYTHGHFDHMGGLHSLLGFLRMVGRIQPLPVYAPAGCTEVKSMLDSFINCYRGSIGFDLNYHELQPMATVEVDDMTVIAYPMIHCGSIAGSDVLDQIPAVGYRIAANGESVAVSGDTGKCPPLEALVRDADLAIVEATYLSSESISADVLAKVHLSEDVAREIGRLAGELIIVHRGHRD
jgi:ribonuclease Z